MAKHFELRKSSNSQYYWSLHADNDKKILASEMYTTKQAALNGINSVKTNAPLDGRYDRRVAKNNQPYFVLKAANGEIIGTSEQYSSTEAMEDGIKAVKSVGPTAPTQDLA